MKNILSTLILGLFFVTIVEAQDCDFYYPQMKGAELIYKSFDKKGKLTGTTSNLVKEYATTAKGAEATIIVKTADEKGKNTTESELHVKCEAGIFYFDMESFLNQSSMKEVEGMEVTVEHENLEMPANIKAGDKLKDGWIKFTMGAGGMVMMAMEVTVTDRAVEKVESITTEAGTFECHKINQTIITKVPMKVVVKSSQWLSKGTGVIKTENYASDGSVSSSMVLTQINK